MLKKLLSVLLVLAMAVGLAAAAFAVDLSQTREEPSADSEPIPIPETAIAFDAASAEWQAPAYVGFHIWKIGGGNFNDWSAKAERGVKMTDAPNIWVYDFAAKGITLDPESQYGVIFYNDDGAQTYNLLFTTDCLGDYAYCDTDELLENPEDSNKTTLPAYWAHQDPAVNGPQMVISSVGNVVGTCLQMGTQPGALLKDFIETILENAREFSGLTDQEIIDHIGEGLHMTAPEVAAVIEESGVETEWSEEASSLLRTFPIDGGYTEYPVTIGVKMGSGEAVSDKDKVRIPNGLAPEYTYDTLTLTATPAGGERFVGWDVFGSYTIEGEGSLDDAEVTLRVTSGITAYAYFTDAEPVPGGPDFYRVTTDVIEGEGTAASSKGIISFSGGVAPEYAYDVVTLTATPAPGYRFVEWSIDGNWGNEGEDPDQTSPEMTIRVYGTLAAHAKFARIPTGIRGDADMDGEVTIMDATRIQRVLAELETWENINSESADVDNDGEVTIMDATRIQRVIAELCDWDGNPLIPQDPTQPGTEPATQETFPLDPYEGPPMA